MAFEKYSTETLKKTNKILLVVSMIGLCAMCFALGVALYHISHDHESSLIYWGPTVLGPLTFIPIIVSALISAEIKKKKTKIPINLKEFAHTEADSIKPYQ